MFPDTLRVDPLDDRNFNRSGILPDTRRLSKLVEEQCAELRDRLAGRLPTAKIEAACWLPVALEEYSKALAAVAGPPPTDFEQLEMHLRTGAILDGRQTRAAAAKTAARYFLAKAFLTSALVASSELFEVWFRVHSEDLFRYVLPQIHSALGRGSRLSPPLAFLSHANCNLHPCGDPRLAPVLVAAAKPVAMVRVSGSESLEKSGLLARSALEPFSLVLGIEEKLARLRAATLDVQRTAGFVIKGDAPGPAGQALGAAVADLERQLETAACWVPTPERQGALAWIDGSAAAKVVPPRAPRQPPVSAAEIGSLLVAAGDEVRGSSLEISDRLVRLRALLTPIGGKP